MAPRHDPDELFRADPVRAVEQVLRQAGKDLNKDDIIQALLAMTCSRFRAAST